jgi:outer membrane immunogenic protein
MRKSLLGGLFVALSMSGFAQAADLPPAFKAAPPPAPIFSWTGFYVGVHVGAGWTTTEWRSIDFIGVPPFNMGTGSVSGFLGGAQVGINYQVDVMVFGVEADFSWADLSGQTCSAVAGAVTCNSKADRFATLTARFGIAATDHALLYIKGGGAWLRDTDTITTLGPLAENSVSTNRSGWTAGGGVEYALPRNWSAKLEYDFMEFGTHRLLFDLTPVGNGLANFDAKQRVQVVKFGLNYRFGYGPAVANY